MSKRLCLALLNRKCREALSDVEWAHKTKRSALDTAIAAACALYGPEIITAVLARVSAGTDFCPTESIRKGEMYDRLCAPWWVNEAMKTL